MRKFYLKDSNGKPSITTTAFFLGFIVINLKLILSGVDYKGIKFSDFTGSDYGMAMAALGAIYVLRNNPKTEVKEGE